MGIYGLGSILKMMYLYLINKISFERKRKSLSLNVLLYENWGFCKGIGCEI